VEIWFNTITQRAILRGTFKSVKDMIDKIGQFVAEYKCNSRPFAWTANPRFNPGKGLEYLKGLKPIDKKVNLPPRPPSIVFGWKCSPSASSF
jgi:hypothetical protein